MKKKIFSSLIVFTMLLGIVSFNVSAEIPSGTVVLGNKAYSLIYANDPANYEEVMKAFGESEGKIYVKAPWGDWVYNSNSKKITDLTIIPEVIYKDVDGTETTYEKHDGEIIETEEFYVIDIF